VKKNYTPEGILKYNSKRHHYIPTFLIKGFTNSSGKVYVYDKVKDSIEPRQRAPRMVFYDWNRNSVELLSGLWTSALEELVYSNIDIRTSSIIRYFQNEEISKIDFTEERTGIFLFFIISLFWRIPATDLLSADLLRRSEIISSTIDPEILRNDPLVQKYYRARLFKTVTDSMMNSGRKGQVSVNIHSFDQDIFVLGDNPILFKAAPTTMAEIGQNDFLMPVSTRRVYSSTIQNFQPPSPRDAYFYNAAVIHQSTQRIVSGDLDVLKNSVSVFKEVGELELLDMLPGYIFNSD